MYRVLFDVTAKGRGILQKCFGLMQLELDDPWNRGTEDEPHVGSIMLAPEMLPAVGIFCLLEHGCTEVWRKGETLFGVEPNDDADRLQAVKEAHGPLRRLAYGGTAGDRNMHVMTGRVH
jgi:hypothetical protein